MNEDGAYDWAMQHGRLRCAPNPKNNGVYTADFDITRAYSHYLDVTTLRLSSI